MHETKPLGTLIPAKPQVSLLDGDDDPTDYKWMVGGLSNIYI